MVRKKTCAQKRTNWGSRLGFYSSRMKDKVYRKLRRGPIKFDAPEYNDEILAGLLEGENILHPNPKYIEIVQGEENMTVLQRAQIVEWLFRIVEVCEVPSHVVGLAINYFDRFLSIQPCKAKYLQILAAVCLLIAAKLEALEIYVPTLDELNHFAFYAFNREDLKKMEFYVLQRLGWTLHAVTPHVILARILCGAEFEFNASLVKEHSDFFIDFALVSYDFLKYPPSVIACAGLVCALDNVGAYHEEWTKVLLKNFPQDHLALVAKCRDEMIARYSECFTKPRRSKIREDAATPVDIAQHAASFEPVTPDSEMMDESYEASVAETEETDTTASPLIAGTVNSGPSAMEV